MTSALGIFVKQPIPRRVKTRLAATIGNQFAADLYTAFQRDVVERFRDTGHRRILGYSPNDSSAAAYFQSMAVDDFDLWPQPELPLGGRIAAFFDAAFESGAARVVLIGSDSPSLPAAIVEDAIRMLADVDCVIGPATDGGYYLIGLRKITWQVRTRASDLSETQLVPDTSAGDVASTGTSDGRHCVTDSATQSIGLRTVAGFFADIDWSSPRVLRQTVERVQSCGLSLGVLPPWYDVDTIDDLTVLGGHVHALDCAGQQQKLRHTSALLSDARLAGLLERCEKTEAK